MYAENKTMSDCADTCLECFTVCTQTIPQCLEKGGKHAEAKHIGLLQLCADVCKLSASAMLSGVKQHSYICDACAKICNECADECESIGGDFMKACAEACRKCAASCGAMSQAKDSKKYSKSEQPTMQS